MIGITGNGKNAIATAVEEMFDNVGLSFIGSIPKFQNNKIGIIGTSESLSLPNLFVQAMRNKAPNPKEEDVLKGMLNTAHSYIESLKAKTSANVTDRIDAMVKESKLKGRPVYAADVNQILSEEMSKAKASMLAIAEAESTKLRNIGSMMDITRVASNIGDDSATVYFVVVRDASLCKECLRLHMMPNRTTPRLWKFSDLKQGYHKRGEDSPSAFGLHPHCRCSMTYLPKSYGFSEEGRIKFIAPNYDAYAEQNK